MIKLIEKIAVLGAGTMGHGIAETFALNDYQVNLYEISEERRNSVKAIIESELKFLADNSYIEEKRIEKILNNISLFADLEESVKEVDFVIEVTPEKIELKQ